MFGLFHKSEEKQFKKDLKKFIKQNLEEEFVGGGRFCKIKLDDFPIEMKKPFSKTLLDFIDSKNMTDVECYKNALIDRKLFSKIRSDMEYKPKKSTVLAFVISLKLNLDEANELLASAGFTLSRSITTDVIIEYFITKKKYDIDLVNEALADYKQPLLGSI